MALPKNRASQPSLLTVADKYLQKLLGLSVLTGIVALIFWPSLRYAIFYKVPVKQVTLGNKPAKCDYDYSPFGNKGCHYEKIISLAKDDDGTVTHVYVTWNRVED